MKIFKSKIPELPPWQVGLFQSIGLFAYIIGVSLFMSKMSQLFAAKSSDQILMSVAMLSLLSVSALICAVIAGVVPAYLFLNKQTKNAIMVVIWNAVTMLILIIATAVLMWATAKEKTMRIPPEIYPSGMEY